MNRAAWARLLPLLLAWAALSAPAAAARWDPAPWLDDLAQLRAAIDRDYPNRDWLTGEHEAPLDRWFARAADAVRAGGSDAYARAAFDRLVGRFDDGHVALHWPAAAAPGGAAPAPSARPDGIAAFCAARGFDAGQVTPGTAAALPGYRPLDGGGPFATGLVDAGGAAVGVVRIGLFAPHGYPALCAQAVAAARIAVTAPCDAACGDRLLTEAYRRMTRDLVAAVERLRAAGAAVLLIDLTRNGGGSEWAEAAARIVTPVRLTSARLMVLRGDARIGRWRTLAAALRRQARRAPAADRPAWRDFADRAEAVANGLRPCPADACPRLADAGFASGLLPVAPAVRLPAAPWVADLFAPAQYPYRAGAWTGPTIVLVDGETWSAAEQFAAVLRDNDAAVVMGGRTGGAGCGHLDGGQPVRLARSGATLDLPNCARFRRDGSNEVNGIVPDVPTAVRWDDGAAFAGRVTAGRLAEAVARARAQAARRTGPDANGGGPSPDRPRNVREAGGAGASPAPTGPT